jgi:hypothetical protein
VVTRGTTAEAVERYREGRARARRARHGDASAHQFGQAANDRQAKTGPAIAAGRRAVALGKGLEQAGHLRLRHADTAVGDRQDEAHASVDGRLASDGDADLADFGELDGVADQVEQDLAHARGIAVQQVRRRLVDHGDDRQSLAVGLDRQRFRHAFDERAQLERGGLQLHPAGLDLGEVEHIVDDAQQGGGRVADGPHQALLAVGQRLALEQLGGAHHAVHGCPDLVAHGRKEGRLGLVRGLRRIAGTLDLGLAVLQLRDIAIEPDRAVALDRPEGELDMPAGRQTPLEVRPLRIHHARHSVLDRQSPAVDDHVVARRHLHLHEIVDRQPFPRRRIGEPEHPAHCRVDVADRSVGIEQADTVAHAFEDGVREAMGLRQLVACPLQLALAVLDLGDVAHHAQRAAVPERTESEFHMASRRQATV